jgi:hypothetical protein
MDDNMCIECSFYSSKNQPISISTCGELESFLGCKLISDDPNWSYGKNDCLCGVDIVASHQTSNSNTTVEIDETGEFSWCPGDYVFREKV